MTETTAAAPQTASHAERPRHFVALDSLRGLLAIVVVLFHLPVDGWLHELDLTRRGFLFVDYFFVLSGFVIAHAYRDRLKSAADGGRFLIRRVGRIWPLHAVMLLAFIGIEFVRALNPASTVTPFVGDREPWAILTNLLMIQAWGIHDSLTWNGPSWSVSAEWAAYLVFVPLILWWPRRLFGAAALLIAATGALLVLTQSERWMNTTYDWALARTAWGFFLGCVTQGLFARFGPLKAGWLEAPLLVAVCVFVSLTRGPVTVLTPLLFAALVYALAGERGLLSRALHWRPLVRLGAISYALYMVHMLVIVVMMRAARAGLLGPILEDGRRIDVGAFSDLFAAGVIALMIGLALLAHRFIEGPGRDMGNALADRLFPRRTG